MTEKQKIRQHIKTEISAIDAKVKAEKSTLIFNQIIELQPFRDAATVALYAALADEPQTADFIRWAAAHKRIVLPRVDGDEMDFYPYSQESMQRGAFGIDEPQSDERISPAEIDLIIVPGRAFTLQGKRLGRGRGYYDRYMAQEEFRATKIGVCYKEQLVEEIPDEPHDILMERIIYA
jgi:5-formyltetrahydrofolate cyclo-ligase